MSFVKNELCLFTFCFLFTFLFFFLYLLCTRQQLANCKRSTWVAVCCLFHHSKVISEEGEREKERERERERKESTCTCYYFALLLRFLVPQTWVESTTTSTFFWTSIFYYLLFIPVVSPPRSFSLSFLLLPLAPTVSPSLTTSSCLG